MPSEGRLPSFIPYCSWFFGQRRRTPSNTLPEALVRQCWIPILVSSTYIILPFKSMPSFHYPQFRYPPFWIHLHVHKISFSQFWPATRRSAIHTPHHDSSHNYCDFYNTYFCNTISNGLIRTLPDFIDVTWDNLVTIFRKTGYLTGLPVYSLILSWYSLLSFLIICTCLELLFNLLSSRSDIMADVNCHNLAGESNFMQKSTVKSHEVAKIYGCPQILCDDDQDASVFPWIRWQNVFGRPRSINILEAHSYFPSLRWAKMAQGVLSIQVQLRPF
jgi:hypothetical protein